MPAPTPSSPDTRQSVRERLARTDAILRGLLRANSLIGSTQQASAVLGHLHPAWDGPAFGVSEFSLSYAAGRTPKVRCIAETLTQHRPDATDIAAIRELSVELLKTLSAEQGAAYDMGLFTDLYDIAYGGAAGSEGRRDFRFAVAVEWEQNGAPSVKCYFDLFAAGRADSGERLATVFTRLDFQPQWDALPVRSGSCRGIAIDLPPVPADNLRLYLPGADFRFAELTQLIRRVAGENQEAAFEHLCRLVLNDPLPDAAHAPGLVSLVYARRLDPGCPLIKLDVHMPTVKPDDEAARDAAETLAAALDIPMLNYRDSLEALLLDDTPDTTLHVHDHLSVDFGPGPQHKLNLYFRPVGLATEHLDPRYLPRRKPKLLQRTDAAIRAAIGELEAARHTGYPEATHRMVFPRAAGFGAATDIQEGRVFQTALIADALLDARDSGFATDAAGLTQDILDLIRMRCTTARGGWRYFPNLPDLPPDADDLAQVMQALTRARAPAIAETLSDPLDLLLRECTHPDGSISTWIIDRRVDTSHETRRMLAAIAAHWGDTADAEVTANLLYALHLYDPLRFADTVRHGVDWVAAQQAPDGRWNSTWYVSPFYGTFMATRLIARVQPNHYSLGRVLAFLNSSLPDFTALDTAFWLLTAALLNERGLMPAEPIARESSRLLDLQVTPGTWPATDFIRMDTTRAAAAPAAHAILTWRSRTITVAVCLKALLQARRPLLVL